MEHSTSQRIAQSPSRASQLGLPFIAGIAVGASLMYLLEPRTRLRRQALLRDKTTSLAHRSIILGSKFARHMRNRFQGLISVTSDLFRPEGIDSDAKIEARVRSALGRATRHAHSISVTVDRGKVSLRGSLAPHEAGVVIRAAEHVKGVATVENLLIPPVAEGQSPLQ